LFLSGVALTIGPQAALRFFLRPKNYRGSAFFLGGVVLVVWGWTLIGAPLPASLAGPWCALQQLARRRNGPCSSCETPALLRAGPPR
jgi:hypothetical protein